MGNSVIFDTHACVKRMTEAGVETHVAEAFATEQVNILEHHIATKTDIEGLRKDTQVAIAQLETKLVRWLFGALIGQGGLIVALVKLL